MILSMLIERATKLEKWVKPQRVLILYGPRRVGKTTLLDQFLSRAAGKYRLDSGDNIRIHGVLGSRDITTIREYASGYDIIALDEAQQIRGISTGLKLLVDHVPGIRVIATGSSSFELAGAIGEPLTGRKTSLILYPFSQGELLSVFNRYELKERLEDFLVFGSYPEVVTAVSRREKVRILEELVGSYLLKDVLALDRIKGSAVLLDLLKLVAFQVGNTVSLGELATQIRLDVKTVARYLDIFEKAFVIKRIGGFSRNLRKEITAKAKYYFLDNGIRNAVISQYNLLASRNDIGALWENFLMVERLKRRAYRSMPGSAYFWRTYEGQELDLVEDRQAKLFGYEFKWSPAARRKAPADWIGSYRNAHFDVINRDNYLKFLL